MTFATALIKAGFEVTLCERGIIASGNGLAKPMPVVCKYPANRRECHACISVGYVHIAGQDSEGALVIKLNAVFENEAPHAIMPDFSRIGFTADEILGRRLASEMRKLEAERKSPLSD